MNIARRVLSTPLASGLITGVVFGVGGPSRATWIPITVCFRNGARYDPAPSECMIFNLQTQCAPDAQASPWAKFLTAIERATF